MSGARAERALEVSSPTAREAVRVLEEKGVLEEIAGRAWGRLDLARPILEALEGAGGRGAPRGPVTTRVTMG